MKASCGASISSARRWSEFWADACDFPPLRRTISGVRVGTDSRRRLRPRGNSVRGERGGHSPDRLARERCDNAAASRNPTRGGACLRGPVGISGLQAGEDVNGNALTAKALGSPHRIGEREDRQIQGNQHEADEAAHGDEDGGFNQAEGGRDAGGDVVFVKFGYA
jgi:hypothetical protein